MGEFWQTLAAVTLGGVLTLLTGYALWKAERRAALRERRYEAIKAAHSAMYDAYNAIEDYGLSVTRGEDTLEGRIRVRHAVNEFLKRNMWLGGSFSERGDRIARSILRTEQLLMENKHQAAQDETKSVRANMREVMKQYREMLEEVDRQEASVPSKVLAKIKAVRR